MLEGALLRLVQQVEMAAHLQHVRIGGLQAWELALEVVPVLEEGALVVSVEPACNPAPFFEFLHTPRFSGPFSGACLSQNTAALVS